MELQDLRVQLNEIDRALVELMDRRFNISRMVGNAKKEKGLPVLDRSREEEILKRNREWLKDSVNQDAVEQMFEKLFEESRKLQEEILHD